MRDVGAHDRETVIFLSVDFLNLIFYWAFYTFGIGIPGHPGHTFPFEAPVSADRFSLIQWSQGEAKGIKLSIKVSQVSPKVSPGSLMDSLFYGFFNCFQFFQNHLMRCQGVCRLKYIQLHNVRASLETGSSVVQGTCDVHMAKARFKHYSVSF